ncbi:tyrosine-type recombinase/integrase [Proteus terrae]|uniref:tyrosine-type recombinase/integrase n=1 Tax=Proteus terrae TaxID=1574161 RepID=UPI0013304B8B|nr:site-specific integrase [Proteus terrae]
MALSDTKLRSINGKPYSGKPEVADEDGLSVRISPKGVITFQCRYRLDGKQHRISIGRYPIVTLRDARVRADEIKECVARGNDPRNHDGKESRNIVTLHDCISYWKQTYFPQLRENTILLYEAVVVKNTKNIFTGIDIEEISSKNWMDLFLAFEKENPKKARTIFVQLKSAINWCIRRQFINSCELMKISPKDIGIRTNKGERVLTYNELAKIWIAIERSRASTSNKLLHQMAMLWGCRLSELRRSRKSDFDLKEKVWTITPEYSKAKNTIRRPIFDGIEPLLNKALITYKDYLFPGQDISKPITIAAANRYIGRIRDEMNLEYWRAHDFRRSLATRLSEEGVAPHVIEKMLGHELGGIMSVYNKHNWIDEQRKAYEIHFTKIMDHVRELSD